MQITEKQSENSLSQTSVSRMVEDIVGCKWSLSVLQAVRKNITHPGEIHRAIEGISTKVLNERFAKMLRYGILDKTTYPEVPPKVEYKLTPFGKKFIAILDQVDSLQTQLTQDLIK